MFSHIIYGRDGDDSSWILSPSVVILIREKISHVAQGGAWGTHVGAWVGNR
jgi:hypothetical protein